MGVKIYDLDDLRKAYIKGKNEGRADAIDECIKVMKYCWYNGQQPLDVLVSRLEQLKEQK